MTAIYKVKFTRASISDKWPIEQFADQLATEYLSLPEGTLYQPAAGIQNFYVGNLQPAPGFLNYSYEEYDPSLDPDEQTLSELINAERNSDAVALKTFYDLSKTSFSRVFNPTTLTHTLLITFDNWANLQSFLSACTWTQGPSKADFNAYLTSANQTVEESFINNGSPTTSPIMLFS